MLPIRAQRKIPRHIIIINAINATFFNKPFSEPSTSLSSSSEIRVDSEGFDNSIFSLFSSHKCSSWFSETFDTVCTDLTSTSIVSSSTFVSAFTSATVSTSDSTFGSTFDSVSTITFSDSLLYSSITEVFSSVSDIPSTFEEGSSITSIGKLFSTRLSSTSTVDTFAELFSITSSLVTSTSVFSSLTTAVFSCSKVFSGVVSLTSSDLISSELSSTGTRSNSSVSTPSLITTVSNCEKGLFTSSFITASGVKLILSCPSISTRSPVLTLTLSRGFTA